MQTRAEIHAGQSTRRETSVGLERRRKGSIKRKGVKDKRYYKREEEEREEREEEERDETKEKQGQGEE